MITNTTDKFIEILSEEGKELFKADGVDEEGIAKEMITNRITAPLGTDLSEWGERIIPVIIEKT